eukprot:scaffold116426_cov63-Attheya_sp.AAC.2
MASYETDISTHSSFEHDDGEGDARMGVYLTPSVYKKSGLVRASSKAAVVPKPAIKLPRISEESQRPKRASIVKWTLNDVSDFGEA